MAWAGVLPGALEEQSPYEPGQVVGKTEFLMLVGSLQCFLAGCQPEVSLSPRVISLVLALLLPSEYGYS